MSETKNQTQVTEVYSSIWTLAGSLNLSLSIESLLINLKFNSAQALISTPFLTREKGFAFDKTQERSLIIEYSHIVEAVFRYLEKHQYLLNTHAKDDNKQYYESIYFFLAHIRQNKSLSSAQIVGSTVVDALKYVLIIGLIIGAGFLISALSLHMLSFLVVFTAVTFSFALHYLLSQCVQKIEAPSKQDDALTLRLYEAAIVATNEIKKMSVLDALSISSTGTIESDEDKKSFLSKHTFNLFNNTSKENGQPANNCLYKIETRSI